MVMHLKSCCCGCTLKTGSVIIGCWMAIGSLVGLVTSIVLSSVASGQVQNEIKLLTPDIKASDNTSGNTQEDYTTPDKALEVVYILFAILYAIQLIINILLIFGASSERAVLVKPWIIFSVIAIVIGGAVNFYTIIMELIAGFVLAGVLTMVFTAVAITIYVYFILVVNSFYTELMTNNFSYKV